MAELAPISHTQVPEGVKPRLTAVNAIEQNRIQGDSHAQKELLLHPKDESVLILRREPAAFVWGDIRDRMGTAGPKYDQYFQGVWTQVTDHMESNIQSALRGDPTKDNLVIHTYDFDDLEPHLREILNGRVAISTDPVIRVAEGDRIHPFGLSRGFEPGGRVKGSYVSRPGYGTFGEQLANLKTAYDEEAKRRGNFGAELVEDDYFGGGSLKAILGHLESADIPISSVIACFVIGKETNGLPVKDIKGVVRYKPETNSDLEDTRDWMLGARDSGATIVLPSRSTDFSTQGDTVARLARAPYVYPYIDVTARVSIPDSTADKFSLDMLRLNAWMYDEVNRELGRPVELQHTGEHFQTMVNYYHPELSGTTPMQDVCDFMITNYDKIKAQVFSNQ